MKTNVIRIGNSWGIRIPKVFLEQCNLRGAVELEVQDEHLVIRPISRPRSGWDDDFRRMAEKSDDKLLDQDLWPKTEWDETEWEW